MMKKTLSIIWVVFMAMTSTLTSCGDKNIENHPDAIAAAVELEEALKVLETFSEGMVKVYVAAKGTSIIATLIVNDENYEAQSDYAVYEDDEDGVVAEIGFGFDVNSFIDSLNEGAAFSNPFDYADMTAKYPAVESAEFIVKNYGGQIYYEHEFRK